MKILLLCGSPHENGSTFTTLTEMVKTFHEEGAETEILSIGQQPLQGCIGCYACRNLDGRCTFDGDVVNMFLSKAKTADGFIFASPVYFSKPNGSVLSVMDRIFYAGKKWLYRKPVSAVCVARRAGTSSTLDVLQKYFIINGMYTVPTTYWPMVHAMKAEDVYEDEEGLQTLRNVARNMVWMIKSFDSAKETGIETPEEEAKFRTNFVR